MKNILYIFLLIFSTFSFGQVPIDTIDTDNGKLVLYSNRTWEMLEDIGFDGIMNEYVYNLFSSDSTYNFIQTWDNEDCFSSDRVNDLSKLKDTVWLCGR
jgi:hypothetical protein